MDHVRDAFSAMDDVMENMDNLFDDVFPDMKNCMARAERNFNMDHVRDAFSAMGKAMENMGNLFSGVIPDMKNCMATAERNFNLGQNPKTTSWSYYEMKSTSQVNNGPPHGFKTVTEVRRVPGGIKETRKVHKDTTTGVEKTSIGHYVNNRAHIIQKVKNNKTGFEEVKEKFVNIDEDEADAFDQEWRNGIRRYHPYERKGNANAPRYGRIHDANGRGATRSGMNNPAVDEELRRPRQTVKNRNVKGSCAKKKQ